MDCRKILVAKRCQNRLEIYNSPCTMKCHTGHLDNRDRIISYDPLESPSFCGLTTYKGQYLPKCGLRSSLLPNAINPICGPQDCMNTCGTQFISCNLSLKENEDFRCARTNAMMIFRVNYVSSCPTGYGCAQQDLTTVPQVGGPNCTAIAGVTFYKPDHKPNLKRSCSFSGESYTGRVCRHGPIEKRAQISQSTMSKSKQVTGVKQGKIRSGNSIGKPNLKHQTRLLPPPIEAGLSGPMIVGVLTVLDDQNFNRRSTAENIVHVVREVRDAWTNWPRPVKDHLRNSFDAAPDPNIVGFRFPALVDMDGAVYIAWWIFTVDSANPRTLDYYSSKVKSTYAVGWMSREEKSKQQYRRILL